MRWYRLVAAVSLANPLQIDSFRLIYKLIRLAGMKKFCAVMYSGAHKRCHQFLVTHLTAAVTVPFFIEHCTMRQHIGREKMLSGCEQTRAAVLQTDFHLALQNEHPLRTGGDVKAALKSRRTAAQLQAMCWQQFAQA